MINKNMTIAEALKENPNVARVFEDTGLDYCCGGNQNLAEAIEEINFDIDSYIELLNRQEERIEESLEDVIKLSKAELIDYIVRNHHVPELEMIDRIDSNLRKLINVHYVNHGAELEEVYQIFLTLKSALIPHFAKEEKEDFVDFLDTGVADFTSLIAEHEKAGALLERLDFATNSYTAPEDGCNTYRATFELMREFEKDLHRHIFLENSVLFE
ncbi:regulator of cell morphogenesis and NO signaling [Peptoniphilus asaccharolyticus DSM 20463]|uniref:Regulator of cell morphogenesis and NO signaling n=1 Tax=Peptoniphilus asaccharolyticus DSM 20463 TaxID=573058 RepID=A0A1W1V491_PEPAS|nr:DUF542 domain-containing protein [Peptoniphilus asaccharolyticus]MBL7576302.1 DUF542 domain-containing protein [Peptoniphilus asaccharolyticus]SMB88162.1 regulator of cell morphogenesis and NO signaling [Peptoniphilus asaccharolyticus DSM 20463]